MQQDNLSHSSIRRALKKLPRERLENLCVSVYALRRRKADPFTAYQEKYYFKPLQWVRDFVEINLQDYLVECFQDIESGKNRLAIYGPHGIAKTVFASLLLLWAGSVSPDCKVITTASAWRQLSKFLWPEIHKWFNRVNWRKIGKAPELLMLEAKFTDESKAFAVACSNPATIEGAHARRVIYIFDEAKTIPGSTFEAAEGAFASPGDHLAIALSTPGETAGEFYRICSNKEGYQNWKVRHVTLREAIRAGRITMEWAQNCRKKWGAKNPVYMNRVWGLFSEDAEDTCIPLRWVNAAVERWYSWQEQGSKTEGILNLGADVARGGSDRVSFAFRYGKVLEKIDYYEKQRTADTMETTGRIVNAIGSEGLAKVDVIGVGSGVVDRLKEVVGERVIAINAAEGTKLTDRSGELQFANIRAAMWWNMRELLDPDNNENICLPDDPILIGDLTTPKYAPTSNGKILIESKDSIREKIGRSTDAGDACVQAFFDGLTVVTDFLYVR